MNKKVLILGAAGFVGNHMIQYIKSYTSWNISVTKMKNENISIEGIDIYDLDILNIEDIITLFKSIKPDYIFHLAAQSSVAVSWKNPKLTVDINIKGTINVLDALRELDYKPRILLVGSGEEYGMVSQVDIPIHERVLPKPGNIYAATKVCQNMIGRIYANAYELDIINVRAFNHTGPNQSPQFVIADFCKQVADIEKGRQKPVIKVGNLSAKRDFTDVRDVVRAYCILIEKGVIGETYNIGSGYTISIKDILDIILSFSKIKIKVEIDSSKFRPIDIPIIEADTFKVFECCGWKPRIKIEQTIKETLEYWRNKD